jgi:hypothetical protein
MNMTLLPEHLIYKAIMQAWKCHGGSRASSSKS